MHSIRHKEDSTGPVEFNVWVDPNQISRIQLIQTSNLPCVESNDFIRRMEDSTFELGPSHIIISAAPKVMVFEPFWSGKGYRF